MATIYARMRNMALLGGIAETPSTLYYFKSVRTVVTGSSDFRKIAAPSITLSISTPTDTCRIIPITAEFIDAEQLTPELGVEEFSSIFFSQYYFTFPGVNLFLSDHLYGFWGEANVGTLEHNNARNSLILDAGTIFNEVEDIFINKKFQTITCTRNMITDAESGTQGNYEAAIYFSSKNNTGSSSDKILFGKWELYDHASGRRFDRRVRKQSILKIDTTNMVVEQSLTIKLPDNVTNTFLGGFALSPNYFYMAVPHKASNLEALTGSLTIPKDDWEIEKVFSSVIFGQECPVEIIPNPSPPTFSPITFDYLSSSPTYFENILSPPLYRTYEDPLYMKGYDLETDCSFISYGVYGLTKSDFKIKIDSFGNEYHLILCSGLSEMRKFSPTKELITVIRYTMPGSAASVFSDIVMDDQGFYYIVYDYIDPATSYKNVGLSKYSCSTDEAVWHKQLKLSTGQTSDTLFSYPKLTFSALEQVLYISMARFRIITCSLDGVVSSEITSATSLTVLCIAANNGVAVGFGSAFILKFNKDGIIFSQSSSATIPYRYTEIDSLGNIYSFGTITGISQGLQKVDSSNVISSWVVDKKDGVPWQDIDGRISQSGLAIDSNNNVYLVVSAEPSEPTKYKKPITAGDRVYIEYLDNTKVLFSLRNLYHVYSKYMIQKYWQIQRRPTSEISDFNWLLTNELRVCFLSIPSGLYTNEQLTQLSLSDLFSFIASDHVVVTNKILDTASFAGNASVSSIDVSANHVLLYDQTDQEWLDLDEANTQGSSLVTVEIRLT